jgi:phosphoribosyl-AMP cyclohydrolase
MSSSSSSDTTEIDGSTAPTSIIDFEKAGGLVTAIAQDDATGEVLMVAYMNEESLRRTLELGQVVYWSRSRKKYWHKGEESGNVQNLKGMYVALSKWGARPAIRVSEIVSIAESTAAKSKISAFRFLIPRRCTRSDW